MQGIVGNNCASRQWSEIPVSLSSCLLQLLVQQPQIHRPSVLHDSTVDMLLFPLFFFFFFSKLVASSLLTSRLATTTGFLKTQIPSAGITGYARKRSAFVDPFFFFFFPPIIQTSELTFHLAEARRASTVWAWWSEAEQSRARLIWLTVLRSTVAASLLSGATRPSVNSPAGVTHLAVTPHTLPCR